MVPVSGPLFCSPTTLERSNFSNSLVGLTGKAWPTVGTPVPWKPLPAIVPVGRAQLPALWLRLSAADRDGCVLVRQIVVRQIMIPLLWWGSRREGQFPGSHFATERSPKPGELNLSALMWAQGRSATKPGKAAPAGWVGGFPRGIPEARHQARSHADDSSITNVTVLYNT